MKTQTLKGFRDFLPKEARKREYVIRQLKEVFASYGFEPLETPALEYEEVLLGKYGQEGDKLMYKFTDRGARKVALRYDQTVPLARVVAQYGSTLPLPFKRYQIQPVWRAEKPQKGRFREFLQCDIDTVGTSSPLADAEIIACALEVVRKLGFEGLMMGINDRKLFLGVEEKYLTTLDKIPKIGKEKTIKELQNRGMKKQEADKFVKRFENTKPTENLLEIFSYLKDMGFTNGKDFVFNPLIVRGLNYYTGPIFELVDTNPPAGGPSLSLAGGGRYDKLIGIFTDKDVPATGISFGFDRIVEATDFANLFPDNVKSPTAQVLITVFDESLATQSLKIANLLRVKGIAVEVYPGTDMKIDKQLKYADSRGITRVLIIGPKEASNNSVTLKNMQRNMQETITIDKLTKKLVV